MKPMTRTKSKPKVLQDTFIQLVIMTGYSGSGKTTAIQALEDLGFFCTDNLPVKLLPVYLNEFHAQKRFNVQAVDKLAVVLDARDRFFYRDFGPIVRELSRKFPLKVLFLKSRQNVLVGRYKASRRRHPLSPQGSVIEGITLEQKILAPVLKTADKIIDTSDLNVHELKQLLKVYFQYLIPDQSLQITLVSFGYKRGLPIQADLVLDVRFLPNPYFVRELGPKTGLHASVAQYVFKYKTTSLFLKKATSLLLFLIDEYRKEGKAYLTIAVGCTGGKHRSVAMVEQFKQILQKEKISVTVFHRDLKE